MNAENVSFSKNSSLKQNVTRGDEFAASEEDISDENTEEEQNKQKETFKRSTVAVPGTREKQQTTNSTNKIDLFKNEKIQYRVSEDDNWTDATIKIEEGKFLAITKIGSMFELEMAQKKELI